MQMYDVEATRPESPNHTLDLPVLHMFDRGSLFIGHRPVGLRLVLHARHRFSESRG